VNKGLLELTMGSNDWRNDGVKVVRAAATAGKDRATAFDFAGTGGSKTWMGLVTLQPNGRTGAHHHGAHEVAIYVSKGRSQIQWGESLEYATDVGSGDFVYFAPNVPHQEVNPDQQEPVEFVVVRSDNSAIRVDLDIEPFAHPQTVY
jgi:uncharacterized RmlC-like cupin family protein